jgi:hypothetical protein
MSFSNACFQGTVKKLFIGGRYEENLFLELDLKEKTIRIFIPFGRIRKLLPSKELNKLFKYKNIKLEGIEIKTPLGELIADKWENFFVEKYSLGGFYVGQGFTVSALGLISAYSEKKTHYGFEVLELKPTRGFIELTLTRKVNLTEIVYQNWFVDLPPFKFEKVEKHYGITLYPASSEGFLTVFVNRNYENFEDFIEGLGLALSFLQGGKLVLFSELKNSAYKIYLSNIREVKGSPIVPLHDPNKNYADELLYSFLDYWFKIDENEKRILLKTISVLNFAKSNKADLEIQFESLLNLFETLAENLTSEKLKEELHLSTCEAQFIVYAKELSNKEVFFKDIVFKLLSSNIIDDALCPSELKKLKLLKEKLTEGEIMIITYYWFIRTLELYILRKINYQGKYLDPLNEFKEIHLRKILSEDRKLLEELRNR